jgi:hypothetical protein
VTKRLPAKDVEMEVEDDLPRVWANVGHNPVPALGDPRIRCDVLDRPDDLPHEARILRANLVEGRDMLLRDHEEVDWRLRVDILERENLLILINLGRRDRSLSDLAKNTIGGQKNHSRQQ